MADNDETRFGVGGEKTRISTTRKIQIKMGSGKIYGPYTRAEIAGFVRAKRLKGEEPILVEGETAWRPLSSDTEFFDLLQEVFFGVKAPQGKNAEPPRKTASALGGHHEAQDHATRASHPHGKAEDAPDRQGALTQVRPAPTPLSVPSSSSEVSRAPLALESVPPPPGFADPGFGPPGAVPPAPGAPGYAPPPPAPENTTAATAKKKPKPAVLIAAGVLAVAAAVKYVMDQNASIAPAAKVVGVSSAKYFYSRPLALFLDGVDPSAPVLNPTLQTQVPVTFPSGFGAQTWALDLKALAEQKDIGQVSQVAHWARWSWDMFWLGSCLETLHAEQGRAWMERGLKVYSELRKRGALSPSQVALFEGAKSFIAGDWKQAAAGFALANDSEIGRWLAEETQWLSFWTEGAKGNLTRQGEYESTLLELTSSARVSLVSRDIGTDNVLQQLASEDPQSYHLWLVSAERMWRLSGERVQAAQRFFVTGLATLSLYPSVIQGIYWQQFSEFLSTYGRQATTSRAIRNRSLVETGGIEDLGNKEWWDFGDEGLDPTVMTNDIQNRSVTAAPSPADLSVLEVLGFVMPTGAEALSTVGEHWAFEGSWARALRLFERARGLDKSYVPGLGGLIWANAALYRFSEAFSRLDEIKLYDPSQYDKYMGLIQILGREPENANMSLLGYLKATPNDAWAHYYLALLNYQQEKNVDCVKSSTIGRGHAKGELAFRLLLLQFRCRVLGQVDVAGALVELKKFVDANPSNIPAIIEYIDGLAAAKLPSDALQFARDSLTKFRFSYELKVKLGELYEKSRDYDRAAAFYNKAGESRPDSAEARIRVARILGEQKLWKEAARSYMAAATVEPGYPEVYLFAARAYAEAGEVQEAALMYRREVEERPSVIGTFLEAAEFLLKINAPQEVPTLFQHFNQDYQGDPRVLTRLAQAYVATGQFDKAQDAAANASKADPRIPEPHRILGFVFDQKGQYSAAKDQFEKYLTLLPQADDANLIRGKLSRPPYE